jgi:hypothetical protein
MLLAIQTYVFCLSFSLSLSCRSFHSCSFSALSFSSLAFRFASRSSWALLPDEIVAATSFGLPLIANDACKMVSLSLVDV